MSTMEFNYFIPIEIAKSGGDDTEMYIEGIASTSTTDADGERLSPSGFDLSYFLKNGYVNWNHQAKTDPGAIVGHPVSAIVEGEQMRVKSKLWNTPNGKAVYQLVKEAPKHGRVVGYSIEGFAKKRNPNSPLDVEQAVITGIAVTTMPKNPDSIIQIVKGGQVSPFVEIQKGDKIISCDRNGNITIAKSLSTTSGSALIPESVDDEVKDLLSSPNGKTIFALSKGYDMLPLESDEQLFENLKRQAMKDITQQDLEKAFNELGLLKGEKPQPPIVKEPKGITEDDERKDGREDDEDEEEEMDDDQKKAPKNQDTPPESGDLMKGLNAIVERLDAIEKKFKVLAAAEVESQNLVKSGFRAQGTIQEYITDKLDTLTDRLDKVEKGLAEPLGRKSILNKSHVVERFEKGDSDKPVLSLSRDKRSVAKVLSQKSGIEKGADQYNPLFGNAVLQYEADGTVSGEVLTHLAKEFTIVE